MRTKISDVIESSANGETVGPLSNIESAILFYTADIGT